MPRQSSDTIDFLEDFRTRRSEHLSSIRQQTEMFRLREQQRTVVLPMLIHAGIKKSIQF